MAQDLLKDTINPLKAFFRHPLEEIARLPTWSLKHTLIVQAILAAASGALAGLFPPGLWKILQGLILFPILVTVMSALLASFFYYYFQIFERRTVSYSRLLTLISFASFPFFLFHIPSSLFPPSDLFGLAMMGILLAIGLTENFMMEKRRALRLVGIVFGLLFVLWLAERISTSARLRMPDSVEESSR